MSTPLFSVCLPTYNYGHYIGQAISSVLAQTLGDFELIIFDDCSTDNTDEVIATFKDSRIIYRKNTENLGIFGNLNAIFEMATGRYLKILCADDMLSPWALESIRHVLIADTYNHKVVSIKDSLDIAALSQKPDILNIPIFKVNKENLFTYLSEYNNWGAGLPEMCIDRLFFKSIGYFGAFDKSKDFSKDITTWINMVLIEEALLIDYPLAYQRVHFGQARYTLSRQTQLKEMVSLFYDRESELCHYPDFYLARKIYLDTYILSHYWYGIKYLLNGNGFNYLKDTLQTLHSHNIYHFPFKLALKKIKLKYYGIN